MLQMIGALFRRSVGAQIIGMHQTTSFKYFGRHAGLMVVTFGRPLGQWDMRTAISFEAHLGCSIIAITCVTDYTLHHLAPHTHSHHIASTHHPLNLSLHLLEAMIRTTNVGKQALIPRK